MPAYTEDLRAEVRAFLDREMTEITPVDRAKSWAACDPEFSRKLGAQGWIGMTWPKEYGGQARPAIDRYVVMEELLAAGAPVGAHWIADRQSGPLIQNYGSDVAKAAFLQGITKGEIFFCIGMSEPNAGSDLAAIETSAERSDGGWIVNGAKLWTTNISDAHQMIALVRTDRSRETRHDGMSQLIIDLQAPGVTRRTIEDHQSERHFGEVYFDDVFVPDDMLIGEAGQGWTQVIEELALERSGPERYLSSYRLYEELVQAHKGGTDTVIENLVGELTARLWNLRQMSLSVYESVGAKESPDIEAAIVKDLGTTFEQDLPLMVQAGIEQRDRHATGSDLIDVMEYLLRFSPIFSLRGGTREILRGIIAREIGLR
ncbi:acyl-CoA dehydrogenase family protein [Emcibacter sp.]|uniref:acyl-CoA dehydrogenase family protein n=1 Tax=Emcibacter sp. TaxID=1979954 RepID=UPI003A90EF1E